MSIKYILNALESKVGNHIEKLVLIKLSDNANDQGICWPSLKTIADHCEISKSTAIRAIKQLEKKGFLTVTRSKKSSNENEVNNYQLIIGSSSHVLGGSVRETPRGVTETLGGGVRETPKPVNIEPVIEPINEQFDLFWQKYDKKKDKAKCEKKWARLSHKQRQAALHRVDAYVASTPDKQFRKNPYTWLNGKCWNDEIDQKGDNVVSLNKNNKLYQADERGLQK